MLPASPSQGNYGIDRICLAGGSRPQRGDYRQARAVPGCFKNLCVSGERR